MPIVLRLKVEAPESRTWSRFYAQAISLALHAVVIGILLTPMPFLDGTPRRVVLESARQDASGQPRRKVIWLRRGDVLPIVDSGERQTLRLPRSQEKARQTAFSTPTRSSGAKQFIFTDLPQIAPQKEIPSPNLVSLAAPQLTAPPPPPRRDLREFKPPPSQPLKPKSEVELMEAPLADTIPTQASIPVLPQTLAGNPKLPRPPARQFVLPTSSGAKSGAGQTSLIESPALDQASVPVTTGGGGTGKVTLAIFSANPADVAPPPELTGNRADVIRLGGAPEGSGEGRAGGSGAAAVPGLTVRGGGNAAPSTAVAALPASPKPAGPMTTPTRPSVLPPPNNTPTVSVPHWPNARTVPAPVEASFPDRPVYVTVVRPSSGLPDWVVWFSDTGPANPGVRVFMRPPVPQNVEWKTSLEVTAGWVQTIWLRARLNKEGSLSGIRIGEGTTPEVIDAVTQALSRWLFSPAVKNGVAVETDVLMEINFRRKR